ncbi:FtsX-like permease family protein [Antarcticibacterium flavum]|uniref:FtsX-like permease family protein n=1 Tax=Antarcticibacterium flavum TaxID=2058175 RepID=A0A5B7X4P3_9FLAO|nr:FtsX-like permease family protein [Antarcticibacterium flavum]MCM4160108.1 ABC transporter permease [Antarcticibacterium sp. W02-3]QCY69662.1 FtsX-like permease family protein [Antarcticibacterium flavum]
MNFSLYIARRYLFTKSSNNAINIITIIAAIGVFAGAFSLFIVLSGFSGLKEFSLSFTNEFDPDLKVFPVTGKTFSFDEEKKEQLKNLQGIASFSEVIEERIFLEYKSKTHTAFIKGVDPGYREVNNVENSIIFGSWLTQNEYQVVAGTGITRLLSLSVNDYQNLLSIMVPRPGRGQITDPTNAFNRERVVVTGVYSVNEDLDSKYVFATTGFTRSLLNLAEDEVTNIEIKLSPGAKPAEVSEALTKLFDNRVQVRNRAQLNETLYKMLNTENLAVYLIFTLVVIIALFNVVGSIIMVILDKRENIKTLHSLGASPAEIRNIFFMQGALMTVVGGIIGILGALLVVYLQLKFNLVMITPSLAYPVQIRLENLLIVFLTIGSLGILASWIAATRSKKALEA